MYILEIKFQKVAGSVDEKLQTCDFKKKQYQRLFAPLNYEVEYIYILSDWFNRPEYKDVLTYINPSVVSITSATYRLKDSACLSQNNFMEDWYTITGYIDANTAQQLITYLNGQIYRTDIKKLKLIISSSGGDVDSAIRIYAYLKASPIEIETIALSQIDSAANIIYAAGNKKSGNKGMPFLFTRRYIYQCRANNHSPQS